MHAFFENALTKVVITFESGYKRGRMGGYTLSLHGFRETKTAITSIYRAIVSTDLLNVLPERSCMKWCIFTTLKNNIKDTSRAGIYHNKKFKESAEAHGLEVFEEDKIGYGRTQIRPDLVSEVLAAWEVKAIKIMQKRPVEGESKPAKESSTIKLICPNCGQRCRVTSKEFSIMCGACTRFSRQ